MRIIKVSATDSTNSFLRERRKGFSQESICIVADEQKNGRGQMGTIWQSENGKNLTFSVLLNNLQIPANAQFKLSAIVSLCLLKVLEELEIENLSVKWPNDILAENKKIAGILIENILKGDKIVSLIIGIGLNVNQEVFSDLPKAASLKMMTGKTFDLNLILNLLLSEIEKNIEKIHDLSEDEVFQKYHRNLFGMNREFSFELPNAVQFKGKIQGVDRDGKLLILDENQEQKSFRLKEVKMIY